MKIQFSPPDITQKEIDSVVETLKSGWLTTGPKTKQFEQMISDYCNTKKTAAMNSATACMEMTLRLLGVGPGDEVITSAYTYTASASVIHHVGAKIVLVDTEKDSFHLSLSDLNDKITSKTKAIIAVDIGGVMCDYDKIFEIIEKNKEKYKPKDQISELRIELGRIAVIADAAHSFGAVYKGSMSGEVADFTCFSFHAVKNLTTGEGGAVTWKENNHINNDKVYKAFMNFSLHGQTKDALSKSQSGSWEYDIIEPNFKCNMTDIMASIGIVQLERYNNLLEKRKELISFYNENLKNENIWIYNHYDGIGSSSGHLYLLRILNFEINHRNALIEELTKLNVPVNVHYKPLPLLSAYKKLGFNINDFPNAYALYKNEITLPLHSSLDESQQIFIIKQFFKAYSNVINEYSEDFKLELNNV